MTWPEVAKALDAMDVSHKHFCRFSGVNIARFHRGVSGEDSENPPLFCELALFILYNHSEFRKSLDVVPLPFAEWGIDIEEG
jgi:hypothetical protein